MATCTAANVLNSGRGSGDRVLWPAVFDTPTGAGEEKRRRLGLREDGRRSFPRLRRTRMSWAARRSPSSCQGGEFESELFRGRETGDRPGTRRWGRAAPRAREAARAGLAWLLLRLRAARPGAPDGPPATAGARMGWTEACIFPVDVYGLNSVPLPRQFHTIEPWSYGGLSVRQGAAWRGATCEGRQGAGGPGSGRPSAAKEGPRIEKPVSHTKDWMRIRARVAKDGTLEGRTSAGTEVHGGGCAGQFPYVRPWGTKAGFLVLERLGEDGTRAIQAAGRRLRGKFQGCTDEEDAVALWGSLHEERARPRTAKGDRAKGPSTTTRRRRPKLTSGGVRDLFGLLSRRITS